VRLLGVDTPESVAPDRPVGCFGREAAAETKRLLPAGTAIRLVGDVWAEDRFGRTLAFVYRVDDGLFVNAALIEGGFAFPLTVPPNVSRAEEFVRLARRARDGRMGLWRSCPLPQEVTDRLSY
jgi:micrococcal nuclease